MGVIVQNKVAPFSCTTVYYTTTATATATATATSTATATTTTTTTTILLLHVPLLQLLQLLQTFKNSNV